MNAGALVFMMLSWGLIIGLCLFCIGRFIGSNRK
jgi:hypothetical protein